MSPHAQIEPAHHEGTTADAGDGGADHCDNELTDRLWQRHGHHDDRREYSYEAKGPELVERDTTKCGQRSGL
ncbi:hypothetical protein D3C71_1669730 [compost metagenome]